MLTYFFSISVLASKESKLTLNRPSTILKETEQILRLSKAELEKVSLNFTEEQKVALRKIAFNGDSELQVRWRALILAARLLGAKVKVDIDLASRSQEWFMRSAAMMAASEISNEEGALLARKLVHDKALVVRSAAVDILGATGELTDRSLLWKIIRDPINVRKGQSLWIRSQALQLLAKSPLKKEVPHYILLLKENDIELQAIAIQALEKASDFQFGTGQDSIAEHKKRWLQWWDLSGKTKSL